MPIPSSYAGKIAGSIGQLGYLQTPGVRSNNLSGEFLNIAVVVGWAIQTMHHCGLFTCLNGKL